MYVENWCKDQFEGDIWQKNILLKQILTSCKFVFGISNIKLDHLSSRNYTFQGPKKEVLQFGI